MMFPIWALGCHLGQFNIGYFCHEDITVGMWREHFLPKKGGQRQLFLSSQGVGLRRNKGKTGKYPYLGALTFEDPHWARLNPRYHTSSVTRL